MYNTTKSAKKRDFFNNTVFDGDHTKITYCSSKKLSVFLGDRIILNFNFGDFLKGQRQEMEAHFKP